MSTNEYCIALCVSVHIQLLQVAVGNVVTTPIRYSIELDAVGELHLVLCFKPRSLAQPLVLLSACELLFVGSRLVSSIIVKLVFVVEVCERCSRQSLAVTYIPSSLGRSG